MQYTEFERKLDLKLSLQRGAHQAPPSDRPKLYRAIDVLAHELETDPEYNAHLKEYSRITRRIG